MQDNRKIYLLYPPISKMERYSSEIGNAGGQQIPLGMYYIASYLRKYNYEVKVTDAEAENIKPEKIIDEIREFSPLIIGIGSTTVAFHRALEVARAIKKEFKNIKIILGGPHITSNVKHAMSYNVFDYGILREGEITFLELANAIIDGTNPDRIEGIAYRDESEKLVVNPEREYISNLDILPFPAYDLIKDINIYSPPPCNYKALPVVNVITSRGCPSQCTFCDRNIFGQKYRERSPENIVGEIKYMNEKFNVQEIAFVDDTFLINKKRIYKLFELLDKEKISFPWTCMSRINDVDYEFLKFLKSRGCWHISFGIESGDEEILKLIKKNISLEKASQVIDWCNKLKIKTKGFFIVGHPGETLGTINKTIKIACKMKLDDIVVTINTPIPGSLQYAEVDKYGTLDKADWSQFNYWRPVFIPEGLTQEIMLKKQQEMYRRFYLRPRILIRYFLSFLGAGGIKRFLSILNASRYLLK